MLQHVPSTAKRLPSPLEIKDAQVVSGAGRGKIIGFPTINITLSAAPPSLTHGVYACWMSLNGERHMGAMHYGPRPVFSDSASFEIHLLDIVLKRRPSEVDVSVIGKIRDIKHYAGTDALKKAIEHDIREVRAMLMHA